MSVSQYRWQSMSVERAQQIIDAARAAITAHQQGGMRSPDPAVRLAVVRMPLNGETFEDRQRARRRLQPVLDAYEQARQAAYRELRDRGVDDREAMRLAVEQAKPVKKKVDAEIARRHAAKELLEEQLRKKKLAEARKAGFR